MRYHITLPQYDEHVLDWFDCAVFDDHVVRWRMTMTDAEWMMYILHTAQKMLWDQEELDR